MVAEEKDLYSETLPDGTKVNYQYFPDGSSFMTAIETGDIQGGLVGPGPAMNHFTSGAKINVVAAGSTGGTVIMARNGADIESPEDMVGKTFISPRVGCTHDVQFETLMKEEYGITSSRIDGEMKHVTGKPATYASMFETGKVDVATVPEPWASSIEAEGNGTVLIDTPDVAYGETLPAAVFVTSQELVNDNPEIVESISLKHTKMQRRSFKKIQRKQKRSLLRKSKTSQIKNYPKKSSTMRGKELISRMKWKRSTCKISQTLRMT